MRSVEASPRSTTSAPAVVAPSTKASTSDGEEGRASRPTSTRGAPVNCTKALPTPPATLSSISSGYTPRMSYALKMVSRSAGIEPLSLDVDLAVLDFGASPPPRAEHQHRQTEHA